MRERGWRRLEWRLPRARWTGDARDGDDGDAP